MPAGSVHVTGNRASGTLQLCVVIAIDRGGAACDYTTVLVNKHIGRTRNARVINVDCCTGGRNYAGVYNAIGTLRVGDADSSSVFAGSGDAAGVVDRVEVCAVDNKTGGVFAGRLYENS